MLSTIFVTETVIENRSKGDDFRDFFYVEKLSSKFIIIILIGKPLFKRSKYKKN